MKMKIQKISGSVLYVMLAITLVILGLFFFGGENPNPIVPEMAQPNYTDPLIYWMYILLAITVVVTIVAAVFQFASNFMNEPKASIRSLLGLLALVIVLIVSWAMGSEQTLSMQGYSGTENVPFWLKLTDMFLYTIYFLMGATVLLIFGFSIAKKFK